MKRKPKLNLFRKILFWAIYDPQRQVIVEFAKYKYQLAVPSRGSGRVLVQCTGFYPTQEPKP